MVATNGRTVTVFGGTGFLGHRIVRHLRYRGFGRPSHTANRNAFDNLRVRRSSRLLLRTITQSRCAPSWPRAPINSNTVCRLARAGMGIRNTPGSATHSQSGGAHAGRHRFIAGEAWICRTWDLAALGRGSTSENVVESRIKEAARLIRAFLHGGSAAVFTQQVNAFRDGLRRLGFFEGRNIPIESSWAEGDFS